MTSKMNKTRTERERTLDHAAEMLLSGRAHFFNGMLSDISKALARHGASWDDVAKVFERAAAEARAIGRARNTLQELLALRHEANEGGNDQG